MARILRRWRHEVEENRYPRWERADIVRTKTFEQFQKLRNDGAILHDDDLLRIMGEEALKIGWDTFKVRLRDFVCQQHLVRVLQECSRECSQAFSSTA